MSAQSLGGVHLKGGGVHGVAAYIIYTPNLGLRITVFDREREQGRFREQRGSSGGARGSTMGQCRGAAGDLAAFWVSRVTCACPGPPWLT